MFSSNQVLEISGDISHGLDLYNALKYVIELHGSNIRSFQITNDGKYVLGWIENKEGWTAYPFEVTLDILEPIIREFLNKQNVKEDIWDGSYNKGFLIKSVDETFADMQNYIKNPFYGIISIEPFTCFYSK
jgi:hypothetical protein